MYCTEEKPVEDIVIGLTKQLTFPSNKEPILILIPHTMMSITIVSHFKSLLLWLTLLPFIEHLLCPRHCARNSCLGAFLRELEIIYSYYLLLWWKNWSDIGKVTCAGSLTPVWFLPLAFPICHTVSLICVFS